jgi:hypothetical protein
MFVWQMNAPYVIGGGILVGLSLVIAWNLLETRRTNKQ